MVFLLPATGKREVEKPDRHLQNQMIKASITNFEQVKTVHPVIGYKYIYLYIYITSVIFLPKIPNLNLIIMKNLN